MVGKEYEHAGMIKHGSKMIQAVTNVTVPKISFYIGASFGAMAFKIILRSLNSATPPTVKDLRAIAGT